MRSNIDFFEFPLNTDSAHGGTGWEPRPTCLRDELGGIWGDYSVHCEWGQLRSVLMHRPGFEIENVVDAGAVLWLDTMSPALARDQHDRLAEVYRSHGITVHYSNGDFGDRPNAFFCRDLFAMTPSGAIIARPASQARAGEERPIATTLAKLGVPILLNPYGEATFEGADLILASPDLALIGEGLRTNRSGAEQVRHLLLDLGIPEVEIVQLTFGTGHLDGILSIVDRDIAVLSPTRVTFRAREVLKRHGFRLFDLPDERETRIGMSINMVVLAPGSVLMPSGNPKTLAGLSRIGVEPLEINVSELMKGGGAVHCMTGVLKRDST